MTKMIYEGEEQKLFQVDIDQHLYNNYGEMEPYIAQEYIVRTTKEETIATDYKNIAWDSDFGILIYGKTVEVEKTFKQLKKYLETKLDEEEDLDGPNEGIPSRYCLFKSPTQEISLIVCHGSYTDFDEDFEEFMNEQTEINWITADEDLDPMGVLEANVEGLYLKDEYAPKILEEVLPYREKIKWGVTLPHVNKIKFRK